MPGIDTSGVEVTNISRHGLWVLIDQRELFLSFKDFPWFADATVSALVKVERPRSNHLRWPDLDVDVTVESIENPGRYPLISKDDRDNPVQDAV